MDQLRPVRGEPAEIVEALRAWLTAAREPDPLIVSTSGSTGEPKQVLLSRRAIRASAAGAAQRLGGEGAWLLALPADYVAGIQVLARSLIAGAEPVLLGRFRTLANAVARNPGLRYVSLVPTQLHRMLDSDVDAAALRFFDAVLIGGGPMAPDLRARAILAGINVVATYGCSETAGGCVYDGEPLANVGVSVGEDGRILISGPTLFDGYLDDPAATRAALVDGWFHTSDEGRFDEEGRLQVLGRIDEVVLSGGVNVSLPVVANRLKEHPGIMMVEVLGVPDEEWGQRVVAFTIGDVDLVEIRDWVGEVYPRSWAPRQVVPLPELPMLPNGKVDRMLLRSMV